MATPAGHILALDISLTVGWAFGALRDAAPQIGRIWVNGGIHAMGEAWVDWQNKLEPLIERLGPDIVVWAKPLMKQQTSAELLVGLSDHTESSCFRTDVLARPIIESTARKQVLGRGGFGTRVNGKIVKGSASREAKAAGLAWCRNRGWPVEDDNESDACVVWEYARRFLLSRRQWGETAF